MNIEWHNEKRKINDLVPTENNPRQMTEKQVADLSESLKKFNLAEVPAVNLDNKIIAGHQRLRVLQMLGRGEEEIDVRVPNRLLTKEEHEEYMIRSNQNTGGWDWDILINNFDEDLLKEWGFDENELTNAFTLGELTDEEVAKKMKELKEEVEQDGRYAVYIFKVDIENKPMIEKALKMFASAEEALLAMVKSYIGE